MPNEAISAGQSSWCGSKTTLIARAGRNAGTTLLHKEPPPAFSDDPPSAQRKAQALLSTIPDWVIVLRRDGTILECHPPAPSDHAASASALCGKRVTELLPMAMAQQAIYYIEKALRTGKQQVFSATHFLAAKTCDFQIRLAPCGNDEVLALLRDVTDRKILEREILEISNREQMRIGQDLHDGLGQHLTGITFLARALAKKLNERALPEASEAAEICQLVLQALAQTRNLARGLFPVEVEAGGLVASLKDLASTAAKLFSISCRLEADEPIELEDRNVAHHVFRIAQEALNNAVRHGQATEVIIRLRQVDDLTELCIQDNGAGLPADAGRKGLGVRIMNYRAQKIGAKFILAPAQPKGTLVTCLFNSNQQPAAILN